jgi:hypothetical protein
MLIDVTTFNSKQCEFIEIPDYGPVEIYRNAPFSITSSVISSVPPTHELEDTGNVALAIEPVETLPWDPPTPPAPPKGFENLPR